ncbi:DNA replication complex GINS protein SLD5 [Trichuris trichiura]|uniref:GINS complex subunit 4 n=1 Tax=Trichuris trichiura TaxID=36087 RepID=A0A077Z987_TRITR|nr:DNA replication complex GINS protein SLD5 [Trichuris trichiura]
MIHVFRYYSYQQRQLLDAIIPSGISELLSRLFFLLDSIMKQKKGYMNINTESWTNELNAPILLPQQVELVNCVRLEVKRMQQDVSRSKLPYLEASIYMLEVHRIRYMLCNYLRIEKHVFYLSSQEGSGLLGTLLTAEEMQYMKSYKQSIESYLEKTVHRNIPRVFASQTLRDLSSASKVHYDSFVFAKALQAVPDVEILNPRRRGESISIEFQAGSQHLLPFRALREFLDRRIVCLK